MVTLSFHSEYLRRDEVAASNAMAGARLQAAGHCAQHARKEMVMRRHLGLFIVQAPLVWVVVLAPQQVLAQAGSPRPR
jgi:hypothetical protein